MIDTNRQNIILRSQQCSSLFNWDKFVQISKTFLGGFMELDLHTVRVQFKILKSVCNLVCRRDA